MVEFITLGRLELRTGNGGSRLVLAHPKRTALLAYLAVARPHGFHRRDALLALLWPELDQERARAALRKAIHRLRRVLGETAIEGRGDEELRVVPSVLWCDAHALDLAFDQARPKDAIGLYEGRFLDAFFVPEAPELERWMETERSRLHGRAFTAAWQLAEQEERAGNQFAAAF